MKPLLILTLLFFGSFAFQVQAYKHKSEAEIARMTPAQRVDEYVKEFAHRFDPFDLNSRIIEKYIHHDGLKALPRVIELINEYDPTQPGGESRDKGERYESGWSIVQD